jgi:serine/threonine-protein kinase
VEELLGQTIGPYQIEAILGSGGMAVVYRARHTQDDVVALKVLFPPPGAGAEIIARFEREARTSMRLRHPAIVRVVEAGQADGRAFMAMALIEGESLADRLARVGPLDETMAADIAWQIADALDYAHHQGVVHRDIKPSNILLATDGRALLTDFGVALALDDPALTRTGHTVGTPAYMAPEQANGAAVDGRADLYSLGVVLYQMVTGRTPFRGNTPQVLHAHVYDPPPAPSTIARVSPGMEAIILRALAKDPPERFLTGAAMAQALAHLGDQTTAMLVPLETTQLRSKWIWPLVIVGILILLGLFISFAFTSVTLTNRSGTVAAIGPSPTPWATPLSTFTVTPSPTTSPTLTASPSPTPTPSATFTATIPPSSTPAQVADTPTSTSMTNDPTANSPPIDTPSPAILATSCPLPITTTLTISLDSIVTGSLGCPRAEAIEVDAARQPFEHGWLLWRRDVNLIYGLEPDQSWFFTGDTRRDGDPSDDPAIIPPNGLYQPVRGFGKVWREESGVRESLGWATAEEQGFTAIIQEFAGGTVWQDAEGEAGVILFNDGSSEMRGF